MTTVNVNDSVQNLVSGLGTDRDKAASSFYSGGELSPHELVTAYRNAWLPRKIIDIPAQDATRKWRSWHADAKQIEQLEAEEKRLGLAAKMQELMIAARLRGGAALYIGTRQEPAEPLRMTGRGMVEYLAVVSRDDLSPTAYVNDPLNPRHMLPVAYKVAGGAVEVHPSRLVVLLGNKLPLDRLGLGALNQGWGDSVLQAVYSAVMQSDSTMANAASLIFEAKIDVLSIPDFMDNVASKKYRDEVIEMARLAAATKGINGMMMIDAAMKHETKELSLGGLPDVMDRFLQAVAGAADIPATRLLGQTPAGLNNGGESDTRNYYDRVQSDQTMRIGPAMSLLDEALINSALGNRPANVHYTWNSLWQTTDKERADIGKTVAETIKIVGETGLIKPDVLGEAAITTLVESNALPGLEQAEARDVKPAEPEADPVAIGDAAPRTLYVRRDVLNVAEIAAWAKGQGLTITSEGGPLHVTIAHSSTPVDWIKMGQAWEGDEQGHMVVPPGGPRVMEVIGKGANALHFASSSLSYRNARMREDGAGWDFPDYSPHITINYEPGVDLSKVEPYRGKIVFGPEIFEELK